MESGGWGRSHTGAAPSSLRGPRDGFNIKPVDANILCETIWPLFACLRVRGSISYDIICANDAAVINITQCYIAKCAQILTYPSKLYHP